MIMRQVIFFQPNGLITGVKTIQEGMEEANAMPGDAWIFDDTPRNSVSIYVKDGAVEARPVMPLVLSPLNFDVSGALTVTGIPVGTTLEYPDGSIVVDDGFFEWDTTLAGTYYFKLEKFPYMVEGFHAKVS